MYYCQQCRRTADKVANPKVIHKGQAVCTECATDRHTSPVKGTTSIVVAMAYVLFTAALVTFCVTQLGNL